MATIEQRIENLFPNKTSKKTSPIATVALIFAERREFWLTHDDVIDRISKRFANSTVLKAFKKLSRPLDVLGGHPFIDIKLVKKKSRGSPIIKGRISEAAIDKIFASVTLVKPKPENYYPKLLNGKGRIEMPPLLIGDKYLSSEDIINRRIKESGDKETRRLLRTLVNGKDRTYARAANNADILKKHHFGRFPHQQHIITDLGLRELASDENRVVCKFHSYKFKENTIVLNKEGNAFCDQGKYEEALQAYNEAIELDPKYPTPQEGKERALNALEKISWSESVTPDLTSDRPSGPVRNSSTLETDGK